MKTLLIIITAIILFTSGCIFKEQAQVSFYVSPSGSNDNPGTRRQPFTTPERARDAIHALKQAGRYPEEGVTVYLRQGTYIRDSTFVLDNQDSGTESAPVVYRAYRNEEVVLSGGQAFTLEDFIRVTDEAILFRLPEASRDRVMQLDLKNVGITRFGELPLYGFSQGILDLMTVYKSGLPAPELFFNGKVMTLARWPNHDYIRIKRVVDMGSVINHWLPSMKGIKAAFGVGAGTYVYVAPEERPDPPPGFTIEIDSSRIERWMNAEDPRMYGFWYWNWADQAVRVKSFDSSKRNISSVQPSGYGLREGQHFYLYNLLEEIDEPGEWYLNRATGVLYFYPPETSRDGVLHWSQLPDPFVRMNNVSFIKLQGITFEVSRGAGIVMNGGSDNVIRNCTIRNIAESAVVVSGGSHHGVVDCTIHGTGTGGIFLSGGDQATLTPAGHYAVNNHIYDFSRIRQTYSPAIVLNGVGNRAAHNKIHDAPHAALSFGGNDHIFEFNEIFDVVKATTDAGAIYSGRSFIRWGTKIRYNYFHDIENRHSDPKGRLVHAIYLDDQLSGTEITSNVFYRVSEALAASGSDITFANNIIIDSKSAAWWKCNRQEQCDYGEYQSEEERQERFNTKLNKQISGEINTIPYTNPVWVERYPNLVTSIEKTYGPQRCIIKNNVLVKTPNAEGIGFGHLDRNILKDNMYLNEAVIRTGTVSHNLVVRPDTAYERWINEGMYSHLILDNDLVTDEDPGFVDYAGENFRLRKNSVIFRMIPEFEPVPFEKMGLLK